MRRNLMSGDRKKLRRRLLREIAHEHRKQTQGFGALRRSIGGWIWQTKIDLYATAHVPQPEGAADGDPVR